MKQPVEIKLPFQRSQEVDTYFQGTLMALSVILIPTFFIPMLLQIVLGIYQLVRAIVAVSDRQSLSKRSLEALLVYFGLVVLYALVLLGYYFFASGFSEAELLVLWVLIPWGIAIYYLIITRTRRYVQRSKQQL